MPRAKKNPFGKLPSSFVEEVEALGKEDLRAKIAEIALYRAALEAAKAEDQDLQEAHERFKEAGAVYREGAAAAKLKISFLRSMLSDKGEDVDVGVDGCEPSLTHDFRDSPTLKYLSKDKGEDVDVGVN